MALEAQAALEGAVKARLQTDLSLTDAECDRMFNDHPPPRCGQRFISVWSDNARESIAKTSLKERFRVFVTITIRTQHPWDLMVKHRDALEVLANNVRASIHNDSYDFRIISAANTLAAFTWASASSSPVGWTEALMFQGMDPIREVGPEWFSARPPDSPTVKVEVGLAQTLRFGQALRTQALGSTVD